MLRLRKALIFLPVCMIFLLIFTNFITVQAGSWEYQYENDSYSLLSNYKWRVTIGFSAGTRLTIYISLDRNVDIYVVDQENMNKYWSDQSFSSYSSGTFLGVSFQTFEFTLPKDDAFFLLIDNTDAYGTPSEGDVSGRVWVKYYDTSTDQLLLTLLVIIIVVVVALATLYIIRYAIRQHQGSPSLKGPTLPSASGPAAQIRYCSHCGGQISAGATFCAHCGKKT